MKKLISILIILLMIPIVVAQDEEITEENVGTLPDSPWYGFKMFRERFSLAFTFNQEAKTEKRLQQAQRRLQEMQIMIEQKKLAYAEKAQNRYNQLLEKVEEVEITDPEKAARIQEKIEKNQQKLEQVRERVQQKIELKQEERERIGAMLSRVEEKTNVAREQAVQSITKNIEKLQAANKENQQQAVQSLTKVRERLQERILVGGSCGTVSPDGRNECCIRKGFDSWGDEENKCIGEQVKTQTQQQTETQAQTNTQQGKK